MVIAMHWAVVRATSEPELFFYTFYVKMEVNSNDVYFGGVIIQLLNVVTLLFVF